MWSLEGNEWQATLVILRLNRAATSVEWGPQGTLFHSASAFTSDERVYCSSGTRLISSSLYVTMSKVLWNLFFYILKLWLIDCLSSFMRRE